MKGLMGRGLLLLLLGTLGSGIPISSASMVVAQEMVESQSQQKTEADRLFQKGIQAFKTSQFQMALASWEKALALYREIGDRQGEANALGNLGLAYRNLGQYQKAIDFHNQSLTIKREIGDRQGEANSLGNLGLAYDSLGQYQKAIENYNLVLSTFREIGDRQGEAKVLGSLGLAYYRLGQYQKAIDFHNQYLTIAREIGDRLGEAASLGNLGLAYRNLGQYQKAIDFHNQSLTIKREIGDQLGIATSLNNLGVAHQAQKTYPQAEQHLRQAIEAWEKLRDNLNTKQRISIFETQSVTYRTLQKVLIAQNKPEPALEIAERGRTRALIQQLHALSPDAKQPVPTHPSLADIKQIAQDQQATLVEYTLISNDLLYIWVIKPNGNIHQTTVNPQQLAQGLRNLNQQTKDWLESTRGADTLIPALLQQSQIGDNSNTRSDNPGTSDTDTKTQYTLLQQLHTVLIDPIAEHLPSDPEQRVIIIPHRSLFRVPFPALLENKGQNSKYLIDKHTLSTVPSIHALRYANTQLPNTPNSFLIAGNPTLPIDADPKAFKKLPGAEGEAQAIAALFDDKAVTGEDATEALIREKLSTVDIIHLAAHGKFDDPNAAQPQPNQMEADQDKPLQVRPGNYIVLAPGGGQDGYLDTDELVQMTLKKQLQAQLVVLSACETGLGEITGDGVVGLSRALTAAGVPSVVVSLWSVGDASTSKLMQEFYTNVYVEKMDKAKGLKQAMLTVRAEYPDPGHWAGFTLIGQGD